MNVCVNVMLNVISSSTYCIILVDKLKVLKLVLYWSLDKCILFVPWTNLNWNVYSSHFTWNKTCQPHCGTKWKLRESTQVCRFILWGTWKTVKKKIVILLHTIVNIPLAKIGQCKFYFCCTLKKTKQVYRGWLAFYVSLNKQDKTMHQ